VDFHQILLVAEAECRRLKTMPKTRSESNKKNLVRILVHFLRRKNCCYTKTVLIKFMYNLIAHMVIKILSSISVNP
jgi:hypothetical protein